jgi:predicted DNA-binding transcriptional regulator AlpA
MAQPPEPPELLTEQQAAALLTVSIPTMGRWRREGTGPPWFRLGGAKKGAVRYRRDELLAWLEAQRGG